MLVAAKKRINESPDLESILSKDRLRYAIDRSTGKLVKENYRLSEMLEEAILFNKKNGQ